MRIVVVEDEAPIREGICKLLVGLNRDYELVGKAENGKIGLEVIRKERPDLVFMDIEMPDMDGLTMLSHAREEGITCKVVILSAYSEFSYAKRAIDLGVDNYLLKPIKIAELQKVLDEVEYSILKETQAEDIVNLDYIFLDAVTGRLENDSRMAKKIEEKYGIKKEEDIVIFGIGLEEDYNQYHALVKMMAETMAMRSKGFRAHVCEIPSRSAIVMILWNLENEEKVREFFQTKVIPALSSQVRRGVACIWGRCNGLSNVRRAIDEIEKEGKWNLLFEKGKMISRQAIEERKSYPFKYPTEIEARASAALISGNEAEFMKVLESLRQYCLTQPCTPEDVQAVLTRGLLTFVHVARETGKMKATVSAQPMINRIVNANNWDEITEVFGGFFKKLSSKNEEEKRSVLIQRARRYIEQYYDQGITLEEIATKLHVSDEYLSSQFRKETGITFTETVKRYRLERIKELLIKSSLKMNQIADMVGYTDSKYMSKVFKEEVGMLPTEYRKQNS